MAAVKPTDWPAAAPIDSHRLRLEPLRVDHADLLAPVLDDPALHEFTGGGPATVPQLRDRFARQVVGHSPSGEEGWLNWVAHRTDSGAPVGTMQATVTLEQGRKVAEVAWVVATAHQRRGYATEAAAAMVAWLRGQGVESFRAHVHPDHVASAAVARSLGLRPTDVRVDGEVRWES